jgi:WD40 repeat protein
MLVFGALCHSAAWDSEFVMRLSSTRLAGLRPSSSILAGALVTVVSLAAACGGGSSSEGPPPPPPTPDFALGLNPQSISIPAGGSAQTVLSATAINGFSSSISVQISGLPAGVTASQQTYTVAPSLPQTITLNAAANAQPASASVVFAGTSSSLMHTANLTVAVTPPIISATSTRTKYSRTDAVTEYYLWVNSHWAVFDAPTSHFFVTDTFSNQVFVMDSVTRSKVGAISVPGAYGIDEAPDNSALYVGTLIGDVYVLDPVGMTVKRRYIASQIGPFGFQALTALVLSNGNLALLGEQGGIPSVDGSMNIAVWNPASNTITVYGSANLFDEPATPLCNASVGLHIFGFALSSDRTSVLTGGNNGLCKLNATTGQFLNVVPTGNASSIAVSPDGRYLAFPITPGGIDLVDANTLTQVASFPIVTNVLSGDSIIFSPDSRTLFVSDASFVYAYSVATQQLVGWIPNLIVEYTQGGLEAGPAVNPNLSIFDNTGLLVGPMEEGFGFLDTAQLETAALAVGSVNAYLNPATGPVSGGTVTQWGAQTTVNSESTVLFGSNPASSISSTNGIVTATTPPGAPGPVDIYAFATDGGIEIVPEGFSYGPTILEVTPNMSTADGGGSGVLYGYGLFPVTATTLPTDVAITVGGKPATITGFNPFAYGVEPFPFLLEALYYTIPASTSGSAADVVVTSSSGSAKAAGAMSYIPALQQFPLTGASLEQGVYDPIRDMYYFTDSNKLQVFSLTQSKWLSPILISGPTGATQRLWGIAMSPDATKLVVADSGAGVLYLIEPANPTSIKTFPIAPPQMVQGITVSPAGVAISNSGIVYLTVDVQGGTGFHNFYTFDTNTSTLTDLGLDGPGLGASDLYLRTALSADNTRAFFNDDGYVFSLDTATGLILSASTDPDCCYGDYDLTLAPNQTQFEATSVLYDSDLNGAADFTMNDREVLDVSYVYGTKFSPDGSLLFQPSVQGMDIYDGHLGILRERIAFPVPLSTNFDALVSDGKDSVLIAITGANGDGIAVVDLSAVPEPAPLSYATGIESSASRIATSNRSAARSSTSQASPSRPAAGHPRIRHLMNPSVVHSR